MLLFFQWLMPLAQGLAVVLPVADATGTWGRDCFFQRLTPLAQGLAFTASALRLLASL